jgi:NADPH-dependent 2,4-dienoyl-CoA reductase/sulfur reductase-like enzyme
MTNVRTIVVVGAGLAGAKTVEALRNEGFDGDLVLVGDERHLPYERPPLSKGYLAGKDDRASFDVHTERWYDENRVDLRLGVAATDVDAAGHEVRLADGTTIGYDKLLLATGSTPRRLPIPGFGAEGVRTLRKVEDSEAIQAGFGEGRSLVVIGGGWIGMEVAAGAREKGTRVTVVEAGDLPLAGVLGPELARVFLDLHRDHGVTFHLGAQVDQIVAEQSVARGVTLANGPSLDADLVLVGVGATPNLELAESAGLAMNNGILVGPDLQTSDPDIVAVGDIANHDHPVLHQRVRVEHWANALNQPAAAAPTLLGKSTPYSELPYFFTDQYDLGMEYVGHAPPGSYTRVVTRGDLPSREFVAFWLDAGGRVLAGMNVNVWDVVDDVKALILSGRPVDASRLADPDVPLDDVT